MRAAITGLGVVTPIGVGVPEFVDSLRRGRQNLRQLSGVPIPRGKAAAGLIEDVRFDAPDRALQMTKTALDEALAQAELVWNDGEGVSLILSTITADSRALEDLYTEFVAEGGRNERVRRAISLFSNGTLIDALGNHYGQRGSRMVISNACASGNIALGIALDLLRLGRCRAALIPGVELLKLSTLWGAERAGFIGRALRPFHAGRDGSILGEGAGALVVQHPDYVREEKVLGWLEGFGCGADMGAAAITLLEDGSGLRRGMTLALVDAGREPTEIEYINAHAPGTPLIDRIECQAIADLFGAHSKSISVNSTKSLTSHMSAASGVVEVIATLLQMREGFLHSHSALDMPDPALAVQVIGDRTVERVVKRALSNACGGGGLNTSVTITAPSERSKCVPCPEMVSALPIVITGVGAISVLGAGTSLSFAREPTNTVAGDLLQWFNVNRWYPKGTNFSYMSRAAQLGAAAGAIAIDDAALSGRYQSDRVAVLSGTFLGGAPQASEVICCALMNDARTITPNMALDHGVHLSAALVRRHFDLNGLTYTLTGSCVAGLQALLLASDVLRCGRADAAVVLGHDALDKPLQHAAPWLDCLPAKQLGEGAGAIVLEHAHMFVGDKSRPLMVLEAAISMADDMRSELARARLAAKLADALGTCPWDVVYLAGPAVVELEDVARTLLARTDRSATVKCLWSLTNFCMAADPMFAVAAAMAHAMPALILAGEQGGTVAALCVRPFAAG